MRVFAGLPMPAAAITKIEAVLTVLKKQYKYLNFVKPEGLHLTMLFFGELAESEVHKIVQLMENPALKIEKIKTRLSRLSQFPPKGNPRVIFVDLEGGTELITAYQKKYANLITASGIPFNKDDKPFVPHVTIARNKREQLQPGFISTFAPLNFDFEIDRLILFQSRLSAAGADYLPLKTIMFK